jgi:hypothetical protein
MTLEELEALLKELVQSTMKVLQSGEVLSDEFQGMIAKNLSYLMERIEDLKYKDLDKGKFPSSNVNAFKYNPSTGDLFVQFHGPYPKAEGEVYRYSGVPKNIYDVFSEGRVAPKTSGANKYHQWIRGVTPSLGASLNSLVKNGGFQYKKLS